jgi:hypothetical protein
MAGMFNAFAPRIALAYYEALEKDAGRAVLQ